ncbi:hypothetical protein [Halorientalis salina]|uniref:hypothetical protein n=1 Tax=Halorientalis salina TaxID=2932266 RepID=UPI0010AC280A|nr:hypothetical protein [Halorientalis salina]
MAVTLGADVLGRYPRFSLYNSPYPAHDAGCAIDLYPDGDGTAPSPVAGEVIDTRTVDAPPKPYAGPHDHLILVETDAFVARLLHVDPAVEAGDSVAVGDSLGTLVRSGFFAPWVDNHIHLGFREAEANPYRASGSLPLAVEADVRPCSWDGRGTVVETAETYAVLDAPAHPAPGEYFVGVDAGNGVLDGGLPHYEGGGALGGADGAVSVAGQRVGTVADRTVTWDDVTVFADDRPITGLSLFLAREGFGVKLVCPDREFAVGETVTVRIDPA